MSFCGPLALCPAVAVAVFSITIAVGGFDPRSLLRIGWRAGLVPRAFLKHYPRPHRDLTRSSPGGFHYLRRLLLDSHYRWLLDEWAPRDGDVVVAVFPKSGTHLTLQMTIQVLGNGTRKYDSLHHVGVFLDTDQLTPELCGDPRLMTVHNHRELDPGRAAIFVTHLPADVVLSRGGGAKYIVMVRDPLDALASMASQLGRVMGPGGPTMEELYEFLFSRISGGWAEYNLQWWREAQRRPERVLVLFYEDALTNLTDTVVRTADFLGVKPFDLEAVERVRHLSSFQYMKSNAEKFESPRCLEILLGVQREGLGHVNKGKAGAGKEKTSAQLQKDMKKYIQNVFESTDFPVNRYRWAN